MKLTKEQKIAERVIAEAWNNPSFKKELMASPFEAIKELTGETIKLPDGVSRLEIVDQTDATCSYFNIPAPPNMDDIELTDAQLETIAGGGDIDIPIDPPPPGIFDI